MSRDLVLSEMDRLRKEMNRMFKNFLNVPRQRMIGKPMMRMPEKALDLKDNGKELVAKISLPGMNMKDVKLKVMPQKIELRAEHSEENKIERKGLFHHESSYKGFYRVFPLPVKVLADKSKTLYKKGVLELHMPKAEFIKEAKRPRLR